MTTESPHRRLMAMSLDRSARLEEELRTRKGGPPIPGDLFKLRDMADLPVEWALLEGETGGKLLAVPADSGPPAGTADVEIPADAPGGPLSLRCRFSLWLDAALFEPELRSGVLAQESVAEARHRIQQIESGTLEESPLAEEVDADPEYQDWSRDVSERVRALASSTRPAERSQSPAAWSRAHRLAAALAVLAGGLAVWVAMLHYEVDRLSAPAFKVPSEEVVLGGVNRAGQVLPIPRENHYVLLVLVVDASIEEREGRFEVLELNGKTLWSSPQVLLTPAGEFRLIVPRRLLADGTYRVQLLPASDGSPLAEEILKIETRK